MKCSQFIDGITELALGGNDREASQHVSICSECASMVRELRCMAAIFALGHTDAPLDVVRRAAEIALPNRVPTLRLLRTSLNAAGARRRAADTFQSVFEGDGVHVRTMYTRTGGKWHVMATVTPPVDALEVEGKLVKPVGGKFEFESKRIDETDFRLIVGGNVLAVPPGSDQQSDG